MERLLVQISTFVAFVAFGFSFYDVFIKKFLPDYLNVFFAIYLLVWWVTVMILANKDDFIKYIKDLKDEIENEKNI